MLICYILKFVCLILKKCFTYGRGNLLNYQQCAASIWMMRQQPYCARMPSTHQLTSEEETVMKPISIWGWLGQEANLARVARVTPYSFFKGHPWIFFLMTTESQDLSLMSHPKDRRITFCSSSYIIVD